MNQRKNFIDNKKSVSLRAMSKTGTRILLFFLIIFSFAGCNEYNQLLKSNDIDKKYQAAKIYYNEGDYQKSLGLLEELIGIFRGKPELEEIYYYYSYSYYGQGSYLMAAFNFKNFINYFPNSKYAEDCQFMFAYSHYKVSPPPRLDQTQTIQAIEAFQLFINKYPSSERVADATQKIELLRRKLELKSYNAAKLYYDMENYKAAVVAFQNLLINYPDTPEAERVYFLIVRSYHSLAERSIPSKQEERYRQAMEAYQEFVERYPKSQYLREATALYNLSKEEINIHTNE